MTADLLAQYTPTATVKKGSISPSIQQELSFEDTQAQFIPPIPSKVMMRIRQECHQERSEPFFIMDRAKIRQQLRLWQEHLPMVMPFYATKCNLHPILLDEIVQYSRSKEGMPIGFDCASKIEIQQVLNLGVSPEQIIFANPMKQINHLKYAAAQGIQWTTLDSIEEIEKIASVHPTAKVLLRIRIGENTELGDMNQKTGVDETEYQGLLEHMSQRGMDMAGVCFHIGTAALDISNFTKAIAMARRVFDHAQAMGLNPTTLDVGGGFPGEARRFRGKVQHAPFQDFAQVVREGLEKWFPKEKGVKVIAEPGRFIASGSSILMTQVQGRRWVKGPDGNIRTAMYYMNEGATGSFPFLEEESLPCYPIPVHPQLSPRPIYSTIIWGPTCAPIDAILENVPYPEMRTGEWYAWRAMGAYMAVTSSPFNGFAQPETIEVDSELDA